MERKLKFTPTADAQWTALEKSPSGAYRIFWHYGPDEIRGRKRTPVITVVAITRHP